MKIVVIFHHKKFRKFRNKIELFRTTFGTKFRFQISRYLMVCFYTVPKGPKYLHSTVKKRFSGSNDEF